jgi:hypothetical protein
VVNESNAPNYDKINPKRKNFEHFLWYYLCFEFQEIVDFILVGQQHLSQVVARERKRAITHAMEATRGGNGNDDAHTCRLVQAGRADTFLPSAGEVPPTLFNEIIKY